MRHNVYASRKTFQNVFSVFLSHWLVEIIENFVCQVYGTHRFQCSWYLSIERYVGPGRRLQNFIHHVVRCGNLKVASPHASSYRACSRLLSIVSRKESCSRVWNFVLLIREKSSCSLVSLNNQPYVRLTVVRYVWIERYSWNVKLKASYNSDSWATLP